MCGGDADAYAFIRIARSYVMIKPQDPRFWRGKDKKLTRSRQGRDTPNSPLQVIFQRPHTGPDIIAFQKLSKKGLTMEKDILLYL